MRRAKKRSSIAPDGQPRPGGSRVPMLWNYFFSAMAGTTWYFQFFFYTMGETQMGEYEFRQLDTAHGQHHHLQYAVGRRAAGMEGQQQADARVDCCRFGRA